MALLAAVDVALLLRLTGVAPGPARMLAAVLATALAVALAQWLIVATQMGIVLGLQPLDSALRLGPVLARQLLVLSLDRGDLAWMLASLPLAALLAARAGREREAAQRSGLVAAVDAPSAPTPAARPPRRRRRTACACCPA